MIIPNTINENAYSCYQGIIRILKICKTPEHEYNEIMQMIWAFEKYLRDEFADKIKRRNMQIKELKKRIADVLDLEPLSNGARDTLQRGLNR